MSSAIFREGNSNVGQLAVTPEETRQQIVADVLQEFDLVPELRPAATESAPESMLPDLSIDHQRNAIDAVAQAVAFPSNVGTDALKLLGHHLNGDRQTAGLLEYIAEQADMALARASNIFRTSEELTTAEGRLIGSFQETIDPGLSTLERHWEGDRGSLEAIQDNARGLAFDLEELSRTREALDRVSEEILDLPAFSPDRSITRTAAAISGEEAPAFVRAATEFAVLPKGSPSRQQFQENTVDYLAQLDRVAERVDALDGQLQALTVRDTNLDPETFEATVGSLRAGLSQDSEQSLQDSVTATSQEFVRALQPAVATAAVTVPQEATEEATSSTSQLLNTVHFERLAQTAVGELTQVQEQSEVEVTEITLGETARLSQLDEDRYEVTVDDRDNAQSTSVTFQQGEHGIEFENPPEDLAEFTKILNLNLQQELFSLTAATLANLPDAPGEGEEMVDAAIAGLGVAANTHEGGNTGRASNAVAATNAPDVDGSRVNNAIKRYEANQKPDAVIRDIEESWRQEEQERELGLELRP